jgi:hypothetical protein
MVNNFDYNVNPRGVGLFIGAVVTLSLAVILTGLRFVTRRMKRQKFIISDALIIIALVCLCQQFRQDQQLMVA